MLSERASEISSLSREFALTCDAAGMVTWADTRAMRLLDARVGMPFAPLGTGPDDGKVARFLAEAGVRRIDEWELVLEVDGSPTLFTVGGTPFAGCILVVGARVPHTYEAVYHQFGETMNRLASSHREAVQREHELAEKTAELERLNHYIAETARIDALTGLGNRRRLDEDLATLNGRSERYGYRYSLALCDIDQFKAYNDRYGHLAGDEALRAVGHTLAAQARRGDTVYRYGGEEFLLVFPEQTGADAARALESLRRAVHELQIPHAGNPRVGIVTFSAGVSSFRPNDDPDAAAVLARADAVLYRAKARGRDCVEVEDSTGERVE